MPRGHAYPPDLARYVEAHWPSEAPALSVSSKLLDEALSAAFHRAAYRFVKGHPDGLAVVISQDGGVSFVANREQEVVFWEQSVSP